VRPVFQKATVRAILLLLLSPPFTFWLSLSLSFSFSLSLSLSHTHTHGRHLFSKACSRVRAIFLLLFLSLALSTENGIVPHLSTVTHCNTLQHSATLCNTLQHTATHCPTGNGTAAHFCQAEHEGKRFNTIHRPNKKAK